MPHRKADFLALARYILRADKGEKNHAIPHNMLSNPEKPDELAMEIEENYRYCPKRKNGLALHHDILSFHEDDRQVLTRPILEDLASEYMERRVGETGIGFAGLHLDKKHAHIHIMCAANLIMSKKKLRLSKKQFEIIKREMSVYSKERYPQITHSYDHEKKRKGKVKGRQKEYARDKRLLEKGGKVASKKEQIEKMVLKSLEVAKSNKKFLTLLKKAGFESYKRGSNLGIVHIETGRKYRLKTLGVDEVVREKIKDYERFKEQAKELKKIQSKKNQRREKGKDRR